MRRRELEQVWQRVEKLSGPQRMIFLLRFIEEAELAEIAKVMNMPVPTVKSHLYRALRPCSSRADAEFEKEGTEMNNDHMTSEQMEALLSNPETQERSRHLQDVGTCSDELESLRAVVSDLRAAVIGSAAEHRRLAVMPAPAQRTPRAMWSLVAATALLCVAGPILLHTSRRMLRWCRRRSRRFRVRCPMSS